MNQISRVNDGNFYNSDNSIISSLDYEHEPETRQENEINDYLDGLNLRQC